MSDDASKTPPPADSPRPAKAKKRRTWKQRIKITLLVLIIGGLIVRFAFNMLLPTVVRKVANAYDLDCTYDRMSLSVIGGNAHIWNLVLRPKSGGDSIVRVDYLQGNVSTPNLLRGRLVVWRAEVDGVNMLIDREPDGTIPLLKRFATAPAPVEAERTEKPVDPDKPQEANLQAPLRIDSVRLTHVIARFRDRSVSPTFDTTVRTMLRLTDVGHPGTPAKFELEVDANPVLDTLAVYGEMRNTPTTVDAELNFLLRGLHPKPAEPYLLPLGVKPIANDITVRARGTLKANVIPNTPDIAANLTLADISATADTAEWAALKTLVIDVKKLNASNVEVGKVQVQSARASARRSAEGRLQVAGFELVPAATVSEPAPPAVVEPPAAAGSTTPPPAFKASLDELVLADLEATFDDSAVTPANRIAARLESMSVKNIVFDPANPDAAIDIAGHASLPNLVRSAKWTGTATPFAKKRQVTINLTAEGIDPKAAEPYLAPLGITSDFQDGQFTANLSATQSNEPDGTLTAAATLKDIALTDRGVPLLSLPSAAFEDIRLKPDGTIHVAAIDVSGPTVRGQRAEDGTVTTLGLRIAAGPTTQPAPGTPAGAVAETAAPATRSTTQPATAIPLPKVQIDRVTWKDIEIQFTDHPKDGKPTTLKGSASIEAAGVSTIASSTQPAAPGTFKATLKLPGIANTLTADGTLHAGDKGFGLAADFNGQGITGQTIGDYLKPLGIALTLKDGRLDGKAKVEVAVLDNGLSATAQLDKLTYRDGQQELVGVDAVRVGPVNVTSQGIAIDTIEVTRPRARAMRHADGTLEAAGVKLVPPPPAPPSSEPAPAAAPPPQPLKLAASPIALTLRQFKLTDGALTLVDQQPATPLNTAVRGSVHLDNASLAAGAAPAKLSVTGSVDGVVGQANVDGTLSLAPDAPAARLTITADKIDARPLNGYFPPGTAATLADGRFAMTLDAGAANHAEGGIAAHLGVSDLAFEDRAANVTWAKVGSFNVRISRFDPAGLVIAVDEVTSAGVELDAHRRPDGTTEVAGVLVGVAPPPQADAKPQPAPAPAVAATVPATRPAVATTQPAVDIAALVADARRALPLLTVGKVDLKLAALRVRGLAGEDAKPLQLTNVRLHNTGPVELAGENAENRPPLKLQIDGGIDPVVGKFVVGIEAIPFAAEPAVTIDVAASGINGQGLTDLVPALAATIEGKNLTDGAFNTQLKATLNYGRRGPRDLDLGRGFTAGFTVAPLHFRARPEGEILAGVEAIHGEGIKVEPRTGNVLIKSIEVVKPIGRFVRDEQGIHALGLIIPVRQATPATQPADAPPAEPAVANAAPAAPAAPPQRPANEIRLDRFAVSGIDLIVEDRTATPHTIIPLKTFDLEVRDVSNQMLWTGKPVRFEMLCTAGDVPLPPRTGASGGGPATQTAEGVGEMRELFSQVTANGRIGMKYADDGKTALSGWAKTSVSGFELLGIRGLAAPTGVKIGGGVFDDSTDIRFLDDGIIETRSKVVFTNLSMSEPADGPIRSWLQLPAPLDVAINAITDADGSITMNLPVKLEQGAPDVGGMLAPVALEISKILGTAIVEAPKKAAQAALGVFGMGPGEAPPEPPVELTFVAGSAALTADSARQLAALAQRMRDEEDLQLQLRHVLTSEDVASLARRANPDPADVRALAERLRRDKADLLDRRHALAAEARVQFAAQAADADVTVAALRATDRQLAQLDNALDQLYELLRPGAANQADRRTRAACLALAADRLNRVQQTLVDARIPGLDDRVRKANPQFEVADQPDAAVVVTLVPRKK